LVKTVAAFVEMNRTIQFLLGSSICFVLSACSRAHPSDLEVAHIRAKLEAIPLDQKVDLTNKEWLAILSPQQFYVMRRAGTELPSLSGNRVDHRNGIYVCSACGNPLYSAEAKFNSGTGWPSFWEPIRKEAIHESSTSSAIFGVEISCARCGSHLGHVFNDGPPPTGLRYCMNTVALTYRETLSGSAKTLPQAYQKQP
jgi:peptide-methionine (R)-S-oxide reductase